MRKYITQCNEGTPFRDYTAIEPETRKEIIKAFKDLWDWEHDEPIPTRELTLRSISEIWNVTFIRA